MQHRDLTDNICLITGASNGDSRLERRLAPCRTRFVVSNAALVRNINRPCGVLYCSQAAIPLMKGRQAPMISTVSSVGGRFGVPGWAVYCATKFAVVGFHDTLRKELGGEGIRVSLIEPGAVYTNWGFNVGEDAMRQRRDEVDALTSEDIASSLVYAFAQPGHVNAQEILVMPTRQVSP